MTKKIVLALMIGFFLSLGQAQAAHGVNLSWTPSPDGGAANPSGSYTVLRGTTSGGEVTIDTAVAQGCTNVATCTFTDSGVVAGQTLYYEVIFVLGAAQSLPSNQASATVPIAPASGLTVTAQ